MHQFPCLNMSSIQLIELSSYTKSLALSPLELYICFLIWRYWKQKNDMVRSKSPKYHVLLGVTVNTGYLFRVNFMLNGNLYTRLLKLWSESSALIAVRSWILDNRWYLNWITWFVISSFLVLSTSYVVYWTYNYRNMWCEF